VDNEGSGEEQALTFTTNVADKVVLDAEHPLRFEIDADTQQPSPYLLVRDRLEALLARSVYYQVMELAVAREVDAETWLGIWSSGLFFKITHCD
jgi:hypothetical protein